MSADEAYRDRDDDDAALWVSTGGTLGVLFSAQGDTGGGYVAVSLDRADVERLHGQLGAWLEANR